MQKEEMMLLPDQLVRESDSHETKNGMNMKVCVGKKSIDNANRASAYDICGL